MGQPIPKAHTAPQETSLTYSVTGIAAYCLLKVSVASCDPIGVSIVRLTLSTLPSSESSHCSLVVRVKSFRLRMPPLVKFSYIHQDVNGRREVCRDLSAGLDNALQLFAGAGNNQSVDTS